MADKVEIGGDIECYIGVYEVMHTIEVLSRKIDEILTSAKSSKGGAEINALLIQIGVQKSNQEGFCESHDYYQSPEIFTSNYKGFKELKETIEVFKKEEDDAKARTDHLIVKFSKSKVSGDVGFWTAVGGQENGKDESHLMDMWLKGVKIRDNFFKDPENRGDSTDVDLGKCRIEGPDSEQSDDSDYEICAGTEGQDETMKILAKSFMVTKKLIGALEVADDEIIKREELRLGKKKSMAGSLDAGKPTDISEEKKLKKTSEAVKGIDKTVKGLKKKSTSIFDSDVLNYNTYRRKIVELKINDLWINLEESKTDGFKLIFDMFGLCLEVHRWLIKLRSNDKYNVEDYQGDSELQHTIEELSLKAYEMSLMYANNSKDGPEMKALWVEIRVQKYIQEGVKKRFDEFMTQFRGSRDRQSPLDSMSGEELRN
ncbi:hypothetical protein ACOSQ4_011787 [Xanthoceras sorbifolium]